MTELQSCLDELRGRLRPLLFAELQLSGQESQRIVVVDDARRRATVHLRANALRVSAELTPRLEAAARRVSEALECPRSLFEVYVFPQPGINGFCMVDHLPVTIGISSEAVRMLDEDEIAFVIGHELGHACFRETSESADPGRSIEGAIRARFVELTVDRVGLLAARSVEASCRAIVKLMSGLGEQDLRFDFARLVQDVREFDSDDVPQTDVLSSHPPLPIRFKALLSFARSDAFAALTGERADAGIGVAKINRAVTRALDKAVDARAKEVMSEAVNAAIEWIVAYGIVHGMRISAKAVTEETGVAFRREEVERAVRFVGGFGEHERRDLVLGKVNEMVNRALEVAPVATLQVCAKVRSAFPGLDVVFHGTNLPRVAV